MKRLFNMLVLVALVNLFSLIGFVGYLFTSGRLNEDRVNQMAMVLRGEFDEEETPTTQPSEEEEETPIRSAEEIANANERSRYSELLSERHLRQIEDRRRLGDDTRIEVDRLLDEIEQREERVQQQIKAVQQESELAGFEKQIEVFAKLEPKRAKDLLMKEMKEADVVHMLMAMDVGKTSKIANACKTDEELVWIGRILNQIGQVQNSATGVDGSTAASE